MIQTLKVIFASIAFVASIAIASMIVTPIVVGSIMWMNKHISMNFYADYCNAVLNFMGVK